ncbi:hypothetical protein BDV25DRAFT_168224 [Aspergillus avenaceus]|uniref:DUF6536 domain-containing protein n=1 Tax=Aspergillus avenaceus TaxID=36643 RepID=A0A5N6TR96_ASPAV|nr:hypothetical protein BDV25DRAFT_168224 [Aspergillus avenaceus]
MPRIGDAILLELILSFPFLILAIYFKHSLLPRSRWRPNTPNENSKTNPWKKGVLLCAWIEFSILAVNLILTIIAAVLASRHASTNWGLISVVIYSGKCTITSGWATGLHFLINILSTVMLAMSNYTMQSLGAPSRADVDAAHAKRTWLCVGTSSLRNLRSMNVKSRVLWGVLLITSLPIHLIYNSVVFSLMTARKYEVMVAPVDLRADEPLVSSETQAEVFLQHMGVSAEEVHAGIMNGTFKKLNAKDCVNKYSAQYNTDLQTLILMANRTDLPNASSLWMTFTTPYYDSYEWMCASHDMVKSYSCEVAHVEKAIKKGEWTLNGAYWSYPAWAIEAQYKNGTTATVSNEDILSYWYQEDDDMLEHQADIDTLVAILFAENPSQERLTDYLHTESNWENSTWAANANVTIDYDREVTDSTNNPIYRLMHDEWLPQYEPDHCLSREAEERCELHFSPSIGLVVIVCNIIKVTCMFLTARRDRSEVFMTMGDAISSFLSRPDPTTAGRCLLSRSTVAQTWEAKHTSSYTLITRLNSPVPSPDTYSDPTDLHPESLPARMRWLRAPGRNRWAVTMTIITTIFTAAACILYYGIHALQMSPYGGETNAGTMWSMGFGHPNPKTLIQNISNNLIALILLANTPQIALSMIYFVCNNIATSMLSEKELNDYALERKPLRVTWPKAQQRSTYYLALPYRYSAPIICISVVLHWLLSQSIFLVRITVQNLDGSLDDDAGIMTCGYSPIAMVLTLTLAGLSFIALGAIGARRYRSNMPLSGGCSAALSAACHPPEGDVDAALKPVMWGVVGGLGGYGHCSFTSWEVGEPVKGDLYA